VGFEGGQMPLQRRLPKRGFKSAQLKYNGEVTLTDLQRLGADEVDLLTLKAAGLVRELVKTSRSSSRRADPQGRAQGHRRHRWCQGCHRSRWRHGRLPA
jgi:hypothetical protein